MNQSIPPGAMYMIPVPEINPSSHGVISVQPASARGFLSGFGNILMSGEGSVFS
jgi:hypothetical protein